VTSAFTVVERQETSSSAKPLRMLETKVTDTGIRHRLAFLCPFSPPSQPSYLENSQNSPNLASMLCLHCGFLVRSTALTALLFLQGKEEGSHGQGPGISSLSDFTASAEHHGITSLISESLSCANLTRSWEAELMERKTAKTYSGRAEEVSERVQSSVEAIRGWERGGC